MVKGDAGQMRTLNGLTVLCGLMTLAILPCHAATQSEKAMMKAVVIHAYGGLEVLKREDVARAGAERG